jgi:hypothetical protein
MTISVLSRKRPYCLADEASRWDHRFQPDTGTSYTDSLLLLYVSVGPRYVHSVQPESRHPIAAVWQRIS